MLSIGAMRNFFNRFGSGCAIVILAAFAIPLIANYSNFGGRPNSSHSEAGNAVIVKVNGEDITEADFQQYYRIRFRNNPEPGYSYASAQGQTLISLIQRTVLRQEAERRRVRPLDADIDKEIDSDRARIAKQLNKTTLTDQEFENVLLQNAGMTLPEYRERLAKDSIPNALKNQLKSEEKVTEAEAKNQNAKAQLVVVPVPYLDPSNPPTPNTKNKPTLTEAEAKQKAEAMLQEVKAGKDIVAVAKSNPYNAESAKRGGDAGSLDEYPSVVPGALSFDITLAYGKDLAEAIHKLKDGEITDVLKLNELAPSGSSRSYGFAKLVTRKVTLPKNFDIKKAMEAVAEQRAFKKLEELANSLTKSAKIEFKDLDRKTFYDLAQMEKSMADRSGVPPTKAEQDAQEAVVNKGFEEMLKRHPDDTTAAIMVADFIKLHHLTDPGAQDRLITLNELIAKNTDDYERHFTLVDSYRDKKQFDKAKAHLDRISKLLGYNTPVDVESMKSADAIHRRLETGYRTINADVEADKEKTIIADLQKKMTEAALKKEYEARVARQEAERQKAAEAALQKSTSKSNPGGTSGSGGSSTITMPPMTPGDPSQSIQFTPSGSQGSPNASNPGGAGFPPLTTPSGGTTGTPTGKKP